MKLNSHGMYIMHALTIVKCLSICRKLKVPDHQGLKHRKFIPILKTVVNKTLIIKLQRKKTGSTHIKSELYPCSDIFFFNI